VTRLDYDDQAAGYDRRAGLPEEVAAEVARAVLALAPERAAVLELGAGTGVIGAHLARGAARYVGLDASREMLLQFRAKAPAALVQADADRDWPARAAALDVVFASRAAHLFRLEHVVGEVLRVLRPGGLLVLGRVERDDASVRATMRARMRELLAERGFAGRSGSKNKRALGDALRARGATPVAERVVATWSVAENPGHSVASWRGKSGLAGEAVPDDVKEDVLDELEAWARGEYGDLAAEREARESYEILALACSGRENPPQRTQRAQRKKNG
jgi:SAM-dependent methyltransferase